MLRKMFLITSALVMLSAATVANAGSVAVPVYPATASIKVKGTDQASSGAYKIVSGTGTNQKLIRLAMGADSEVAYPNEKNLVLGYVPAETPFSCDAEVVVWNKVTLQVVGVLAYVNSCYGPTFQKTVPAPGKSGSESYLQTSRVYFEDTTENCSSLNNSLLSGTVAALGEVAGKKPVEGNTTATSFKFTRFVGDVEIEGDDSPTVVDGSITATFTKTLGTTSAVLYSSCQ